MGMSSYALCRGALRLSSPHNTASHSGSRTRQGALSPQHENGPRRPLQSISRHSLAQAIPFFHPFLIVEYRASWGLLQLLSLACPSLPSPPKAPCHSFITQCNPTPL